MAAVNQPLGPNWGSIWVIFFILFTELPSLCLKLSSSFILLNTGVKDAYVMRNDRIKMHFTPTEPKHVVDLCLVYYHEQIVAVWLTLNAYCS